jgi:hypothetical protein
MKKPILILSLAFFSLSAFALENGPGREVLCDLEVGLALKESNTYRTSAGPYYQNINDRVRSLEQQSRTLVRNNCMAGNGPRTIAAQIATLWTEGCAAIVNPVSNQICRNFQSKNDGTSTERLAQEIPALNALLRSAGSAAADCSPGVTDDTLVKDINHSVTPAADRSGASKR